MNDFESTVPDMYLYQYSSPEQNGKTITFKSTQVRVEIQKLRDLRKMVTKHLPTTKY